MHGSDDITAGNFLIQVNVIIKWMPKVLIFDKIGFSVQLYSTNFALCRSCGVETRGLNPDFGKKLSYVLICRCRVVSIDK